MKPAVLQAQREIVARAYRGLPLSLVFDEIQSVEGIDRSVLREAFSRLSYERRVVLTDDRRLVVPDALL